MVKTHKPLAYARYEIHMLDLLFLFFHDDCSILVCFKYLKTTF